MGKRKVLGIASLIAAVLAFAVKETISGIISELASKILHPKLLSGEGDMTSFSLTDIIILILIAFGFLSLFWPKISNFFQTEIERRSVFDDRIGRRTIVGATFLNSSEAMFLSLEKDTILVDCNFKIDDIALNGVNFADYFTAGCRQFVKFKPEEADAIRKCVPTLERAISINSHIKADRIFLHAHSIDQFLTDLGSVRGKIEVVDFSPDMLVQPTNFKSKLVKWIGRK